MSVTAFLIIALVIVVNQDGAAQLVENSGKIDQIALEAKNKAVTIIDGPKYVAPPPSIPQTANNIHKPEQRPPSKPPIKQIQDRPAKPKYTEIPRVYYGIHSLPSIRQYSKPVKQPSHNSVYKYHKVVPVHRNFYQKQQPLAFAASAGKPAVIAKNPKFNLPVETINGIRSDFVRPPHSINTTSTTSTTAATTTTRLLRTKRIWPKYILNKMNATNSNSSESNKTSEDLHTASSHQSFVVDKTVTTNRPSTTRGWRVTRAPREKTTSTSAPAKYTTFEPNDWVPIIPSHFPVNKVRKFKKIPIRRSDYSDVYFFNSKDSPIPDKRMLYLHSYGLVPMASSRNPSNVESSNSLGGRKNIIVLGNNKQALNPNMYSGYRRKPVQTPHVIEDYQYEESHPSKIITRIKHHHHHHHHRYIKTVNKPYKVEVPKPVPVPVPVPVKVEQKVPYPVPVKVPYPIPVKVVEKEYVPKPYPVIQHVPILKQVEVKVPQAVPYPVEKQVPYPVHVKVPVDKPYPVPIHVEKKVPYPVPVKILVPQPYPIETKVPYAVKEPIEVIKHVPIRVPVPQPYPVKVPVKVPVTVEKKVPYPVEVEKKIPVPFKVLVPEKVEVEKKVPVYIPQPYPVEKKVPYPVKVPVPVRVPIKVPYGIPILVHPSPNSQEQTSTELRDDITTNNQEHSHYSYSVHGNTVTSAPQHSVTVHGNLVTDIPHHSVTVHGNIGNGGVTSSPHHTVTVHGKAGFVGFQSRSDIVEHTTPSSLATTLTTSPSVDQVATEHTRNVTEPSSSEIPTVTPTVSLR